MPRKRKDSRDTPVPKDRAYGERQKAIEATSRLSSTQGPGEQMAGMMQQPAPQQDPMAVAQQSQMRTGLLSAPSSRPQVPVTDGLPMGAGANTLQPQQQGPSDVELAVYAKYLPALEILASRDDSTPATRQYVRRLRAMIPPGYLQKMIAQGQPEPTTNQGA